MGLRPRSAGPCDAQLGADQFREVSGARPSLLRHEELDGDLTAAHLDRADHSKLRQPATKVGVLECSNGVPDIGFGRAQGLLQQVAKGRETDRYPSRPGSPAACR